MSARNVLVEGHLAGGEYGPRIILTLREPRAAAYLRTVIDGLAAAGIGASVRLEEDPRISLGPTVANIELRVVARAGRRRLSRRRDGTFIWVGTPYDWETTSLLIEPLAEGANRYQYLTSEIDDDALVEVSQVEVRD